MSKFGFAALVGRPNAGKSSLLNAFLQENLCPVTNLPQTTRQCLRGVLNTPKGQIAFIDTPGLHQGNHQINEAMAWAAEETLGSADTDVILYVVDLSREFGEEESRLAALVEKKKEHAFILFNKSDTQENPGARILAYFRQYPGLWGVPHRAVSAFDLKDRDAILDDVFQRLREGEPHFPADDLTDASLRFLACEIIRAQVIRNTSDEVPHATAVLIDRWNEGEEGTEGAEIAASLVVETEGQKKIMIGQDGKRIRQIRLFSRKEIAKLAQIPIQLSLHVKVRPRWRDNPAFLREMGMRMTLGKTKGGKGKGNRR